MLTPVGRLYNICKINFFFFVDPKNFEGLPLWCFFGSKIFSEFDETLYTDAPFDGDHFIIKYIFC